MLTLDTLKAEIAGQLLDIPTKHHLSVRWEPAPGICRVGVCVHEYNWDIRATIR